MLVPEPIDDGKLSQEIILALQTLPGKNLHSHIQILIRQVPFVNHPKPTLSQLPLLIELIRGLEQILVLKLPRSPGQALQGSQYMRVRPRQPPLPEEVPRHRRRR